jgi:hypothetical protein
MHMTHHGYFAFQVLKKLTCTECGFGEIKKLLELRDRIVDDVLKLELEYAATSASLIHRVKPLSWFDESFERDIAIMPWFFKCNPGRFPTWEGKNDPRTSLTSAPSVTLED